MKWDATRLKNAMSGKLIAALLLIGFLILIVIVNSGSVTINLLFGDLHIGKTILIFATFVAGLVTGVLLKGH
jgi:uncharacterized integral membrane protein